jgi:hypothetical protein
LLALGLASELPTDDPASLVSGAPPPPEPAR